MNEALEKQWREEFEKTFCLNFLVYESDGEYVNDQTHRMWLAYKTARKKAQEEYGHMKSLLKDICDEWNEACEDTCNSHGHDEECCAVDIANAKRKLNQETTALKAENNILKKELDEWKSGRR